MNPLRLPEFATARPDQLPRLLRELVEAVRGRDRSLLAIPWLDGVYLDTDDGGIAGEGLSFTSGTARDIPHGLGRRWRGFVAMAATTADPRLFATRVDDETDSLTIRLQAATTGACAVWVY